MIAEILFPIALDKTFYYRVDEKLKDKIKPGIRIYTPLAYRNKVLGYVISVKEEEEINLKEIPQLKSIIKIIDEKPIYNIDEFKKISEFISNRWFSPWGLVLENFLRHVPLKLNLKEKSEYKKTSLENTLYITENAIEKIFDIIKTHSDRKLVIFLPNIFSIKYLDSLIRKKFPEISNQIYHFNSAVKESQRKNVVRAITDDSLKILLTTKSGIFLPHKEDSIFIVVDPLNENYRQFEQHPYYETVELLFEYSKIFKIPLILFSTSNSILFIQKQKEKRLEIINEYTKDINPEIEEFKNQVLSEKLKKLVYDALEYDKKLLVISHSKYIARFLVCPKCKFIKRCDKCRTVMYLDKIDDKSYYICPYCQRKEEFMGKCERCSSEMMFEHGYGTKKIYEEILKLFPENSKDILLLDGSKFIRYETSEYIIKRIMESDFKIIISTEIIISPLLKEKFSSVFYKNNERHINYDYTYNQRLLNNLTNLNIMKKENFILETYNTEEELFKNLNNIDNYLKDEYEIRKDFNYPPFAYIYNIELRSKDKNHLREFVNNLIAQINDEFKKEYEVIDFTYRHTVRKERGQKTYLHKSYIKLKTYEKFFNYIKELTRENKIEINIIPV